MAWHIRHMRMLNDGDLERRVQAVDGVIGVAAGKCFEGCGPH